MKKWFLELKGNFDSRKNLRRASANSIWIFNEQIIRIIIGFVTSVVTTRYLGPQGLGLLSYSMSFAYIFSVLVGLGIDNIVIKKLVENRFDKGKILGSAFILKLTGGVFSFLLPICLIGFFSDKSPQVILMVVLISFGNIFQSFNIIDFLYQSELRVKCMSIVRIISYVVIALLKIVLVLLGANIFYFAFIFSLEYIFNAIGYIYLYRKDNRIQLSFDRNVSIDLLKSGFPLFVTSVIYGWYLRIDQLLIGHFLNAEVLGSYFLAVSLVQLFYFLPNVINVSVYPILLEEKLGNRINSYKEKVWMTLKYFALIGIIIALGTNIVSGIFIRIFYGNKFEFSVGLLNLYVWNLVFVFSSSILNYCLIIENRQKYILYCQIFVLMLNFALNWFLISKFGVYGAVVTSLVSNFISFFIFFMFFYRIKKI